MALLILSVTPLFLKGTIIMKKSTFRALVASLLVASMALPLVACGGEKAPADMQPDTTAEQTNKAPDTVVEQTEAATETVAQ